MQRNKQRKKQNKEYLIFNFIQNYEKPSENKFARLFVCNIEY